MENRIKTIDIAKGLGILLVVIGHSLPTESYPMRVIWAFHMPLFFFLSGFCYNQHKYTFRKLFKTRVRQLLVPLLIFSAVLLVLRIPILKFPVYFSIWNLFPFSLWFVFILFLTELFGFHIVRLPIYIAILIGLVSVVLYNYGIKLPYSLSSLPAAIMFYAIGHKLKQKQEANACNFNIINNYLGIIVGFFILGYAYFNPIYLTMCDGVIPLFSLFPSIGGIMLTMEISKNLEKAPISNIFVFLGKNTFVIMAVHQFFMYIASVHIKPILSNGFLEITIYKILQQIIMWSGVLITIWFVNNKAKWLIGKQ